MNDDVFLSVYEAILRRDPRYDGIYYVGISSTGIFCRPSCRSRTPKPDNVKVYSSSKEALQAGFRPCKRCRPETPGPDGPDAKLVHAVNEIIAKRYNENLTLDTIASELSMSPFHLQRVFKRMTGTTPSKQLQHTRLFMAKLFIDKKDSTVAQIASLVGYQSTSHFSVVFKKAFGCSPIEYRRKPIQLKHL